jgi:hypothetical protein
VVAGVGPFDGSLVNSFFDSLKKTAPTYPFTILPFSYYSVVWNLLANPVYTTVIDPIACKPVPGSLECASYLMSGGLALMAPWPGGFTDYPLVFAQNVPAVQLEFQGRSGGMTGDCRVLGSKNTLIAAEVCIEKVGASTIYAGKLPYSFCLTIKICLFYLANIILTNFNPAS